MAMLRVPRSFLTINNNRPDWSEDDTRAFLDALYRDNTDTIVRAGARSARYRDQHRRPFPQMRKGDTVMVHKAALGGYFAAMSGVEAATAKLKSLPLWHYHIMAHPSPNVYEVDVPRGTRVHRRINVKNLRPAEGLDCDKPPPVQVGRSGVEYAVEGITDHKRRSGQTYVFVKWVGAGWPQTWEPLANVRHLHILVDQYFKGKVPAK
jgi:hypothetical protein